MFISYILSDKLSLSSCVLDPRTRKLFESSISQSDIPKFDELVDFIHLRYKILESIKGADRSERAENRPNRVKAGTTSKLALTSIKSTSESTSSGNKPNSICAFCNESSHCIYQCFKFKRLVIPKCRDFVLSKELCFLYEFDASC